MIAVDAGQTTPESIENFEQGYAPWDGSRSRLLPTKIPSLLFTYDPCIPVSEIGGPRHSLE